MDDLDHLLAGGEAFQYLLPHGALPHRGYEVLHYLEIDVGFQEGQTDLPHRLVDIFLVQFTFTAQAAQGILQLFSQASEHSFLPYRCRIDQAPRAIVTPLNFSLP